MAKPHASKAKYEFGGPPGAAAIVFGLPILMYFFFLTCNDVSGCPSPALLQFPRHSWQKLKSQTPWPHDGIAGLASWRVTGWTLVYYILSLLLYRFLPAQEVRGTKLRQSGRHLDYRLNAFLSSIVQLAACAVGTLIYGSHFAVWTFIDENVLQILTTNIILSYLISIFVYVRSFSIQRENSHNNMRELARGGCTGSIIYDFYIGRELNPRITLPIIGEIDIKEWMEMRPGLTGWILLDLAFMAKQHRNFGFLSDSMLFVTAVQTYYVLEGQYAEEGVLVMMDIVSDGLGFMLSFGDIVWVPFLYSTQCRYLSVYPLHLGWGGIAAVSAVFFIGLYIFRASNNQKALFRRSAPDHPDIKAMTYIKTKRGTRLLTSGWWGVARHINYFGDWLQASPFSLPTGIAGYLVLPPGAGAMVGDPDPSYVEMRDGRVVTAQGGVKGWGMFYTYFYIVYFATLLIHRERRDDEACAEKYGADWVKYKKQVPWRIIPGVY